MTLPNDSPQSSPRRAPNADALYEQGMAYYQRREWQQALEQFHRLKAAQPNWPGLDSLIDEASWLLQLETVEPGTATPVQDVRLEPRRSGGALRWLVGIIAVALALGALAWWQGWLPGMNSNAQYEALYNRGQSNLAVGDYLGAKEAFSTLAQQAPARYAGLAEEGLQRAARLEQVATDYEDALTAIEAEDWDTAEAKLRAVLAVDAVYADASTKLDAVLRQREVTALFRAGVAAYDDGQSAEAISQLENLTELDATYQQDAVREVLFVSYLRDGRALLATPDASADTIRQAIARFGKALSLRPRNVEASAERELASRYLNVRQALDQQDTTQAEARLAELLQEQPEYADGQAMELYYRLLVARADATRTAGDEAAALSLYNQAALLPVRDPAAARAALQQLQPAAPAVTAQAGPTPFVEVQAENLNVRLGPGTDYPVLGQLKAGAQLALVGRNDASDWLVVCCVDDKPGWVAARLVQTAADLAALPVGLVPTRVPTATPAPLPAATATATRAPAAAATPTVEPTATPVPTPTPVPAAPPAPPAPTEPPPTATPPPR